MKADLISAIASKLGRYGSEPALKAYRSYDEALRDSDTYEDPAIVDTVRRKTEVYRERLLAMDVPHVSDRQTLQNLFVLSHVCSGRPLNVIEFGGACGATFFELQHLLPEKIGKWAIVETPAMTEAGKRVADDGGLSFHPSLDSATTQIEKPDLIFAQGVLQYAPSPLTTLDMLLGIGADYIYVSRTAVTVENGKHGRDVVFTRQVTQLSAHGPGAFPPASVDKTTTQPLTLISRELMTNSLLPRYTPIFWFDDAQARTVIIGAEKVTSLEIGFLAQRQTASIKEHRQVN